MKLSGTALFLLLFYFGRSQAPIAILPLPDYKTFSSTQPDSVFLHWKNKMQQYQQHNDQTGVALCLQKMAQTLYHLGNFSAAIEKFLQAEQIFRNLRQYKLLADNLSLTATVYYYNQQPREAYRQLGEAQSVYEKLDDRTGLANIFGQLGHYYEKQHLYDSAHFYQSTALLYAASGDDQSITAKIYENIGSIYEDQLQFDSARHYFLLSLKLNQQLNLSVNQIEVLNNLGDVHRKKGEYEKGLSYARQAMQLAISTKEKYQLQSAYRDMALNFRLMQQPDSAYEYLLQSRELIQQLYATENSQQITMLQALYDTENKNAEIARLNAISKTNLLFNIVLITSAVLVALIAFVIISKQKAQSAIMTAELKVKQLEEDSLKQQLDQKSRELSSHLLHLIQKNETMEALKKGLTDISHDERRDQKKQVRQLLQQINFSFSQDAYWNEFRLIFDQVHQSFFDTLHQRFPDLSASERRLLSLLKMNLSSGDISTLLGVTADSLRVMRYRIKKKIHLEPEQSLTAFVQSI